jgi:tetratricopeptide (TPR) repeat protein
MNLTWNPNGIERRELTCPACRATTPDIVVSVLEVVQLHTIRANIDKAEKWTHFEQALEHLDRLDQIGALEKNQQQRLAALCTRGEVLMSLERWAEALEVFEECETLSEQGAQNMMAMYKRAEDHEQALNEGRHEDAEKIFREITEKKEGGMIMCKMDMDQVRLYRNIAMCKAETEDYEGALDVYKFKITPSMEHLSSMGYDREMPRESLLNSMGMAKCLYHLQDYENAIKAGVGALEFDRSYRQVHKHIALSLRAIGKLEDAIKIMGMAVNYEAPWDEQNRKINLELYQELRTASN